MIKLQVYNQQAEPIKEIKVSSRIFGRAPKTEVIHQVVVAQQANGRQVLAHAKDRSEVRGGGRKPWRQKGTGNARHGSIRSPLWIGGGVTFGPTKERNFKKAVNKKQKQAALAMCLSDKVEDGRLIVFDKLENSSGKTKALVTWLKTVADKIEALKETKKFLLILDTNDRQLIKAAMNLNNVRVVLADSLNCVELLNSQALLASEKAMEKIDQHYRKLSDSKKQTVS
ncbi:MAG TPA: 50S ribosomal protein L4 [bacterium]|nr:50S ribosomal protein L4 [bacterium]HNS34293.1 50S ribosomal protein L4 [bacterium]HNZ73041.1 50S ribosomal protein L4 [bacterium]HOH67137.1 50S ribosomal protein L4 [bacterium]HQA63838.1 50S ribosomal protein L4 [bacterium]